MVFKFKNIKLSKNSKNIFKIVFKLFNQKNIEENNGKNRNLIKT